MILEEGGYTRQELEEHFEEMVNIFLTDEDALRGIPTGRGLSTETDTALFAVAKAVADGVDPQPAIDNAWIAFNDLFTPSDI